MPTWRRWRHNVPSKKPRKFIGFNLPYDTYERLVAYCQRRGVAMPDVLRAAMRRQLAKMQQPRREQDGTPVV